MTFRSDSKRAAFIILALVMFLFAYLWETQAPS